MPVRTSIRTRGRRRPHRSKRAAGRRGLSCRRVAAVPGAARPHRAGPRAWTQRWPAQSATRAQRRRNTRRGSAEGPGCGQAPDSSGFARRTPMVSRSTPRSTRARCRSTRSSVARGPRSPRRSPGRKTFRAPRQARTPGSQKSPAAWCVVRPRAHSSSLGGGIHSPLIASRLLWLLPHAGETVRLPAPP